MSTTSGKKRSSTAEAAADKTKVAKQDAADADAPPAPAVTTMAVANPGAAFLSKLLSAKKSYDPKKVVDGVKASDVKSFSTKASMQSVVLSKRHGARNTGAGVSQATTFRSIPVSVNGTALDVLVSPTLPQASVVLATEVRDTPEALESASQVGSTIQGGNDGRMRVAAPRDVVVNLIEQDSPLRGRLTSSLAASIFQPPQGAFDPASVVYTGDSATLNGLHAPSKDGNVYLNSNQKLSSPVIQGNARVADNTGLDPSSGTASARRLISELCKPEMHRTSVLAAFAPFYAMAPATANDAAATQTREELGTAAYNQITLLQNEWRRVQTEFGASLRSISRAQTQPSRRDVLAAKATAIQSQSLTSFIHSFFPTSSPAEAEDMDVSAPSPLAALAAPTPASPPTVGFGASDFGDEGVTMVNPVGGLSVSTRVPTQPFVLHETDALLVPFVMSGHGPTDPTNTLGFQVVRKLFTEGQVDQKSIFAPILHAVELTGNLLYLAFAFYAIVDSKAAVKDSAERASEGKLPMLEADSACFHVQISLGEVASKFMITSAPKTQAMAAMLIKYAEMVVVAQANPIETVTTSSVARGWATCFEVDVPSTVRKIAAKVSTEWFKRVVLMGKESWRPKKLAPEDKQKFPPSFVEFEGLEASGFSELSAEAGDLEMIQSASIYIVYPDCADQHGVYPDMATKTAVGEKAVTSYLEQVKGSSTADTLGATSLVYFIK